MLSTCTEPGCRTLVYGIGFCLAHERPSRQVFVRGRPFQRAGADESDRSPSAGRRLSRRILSARV
jgi:hypothetical protein